MTIGSRYCVASQSPIAFLTMSWSERKWKSIRTNFPLDEFSIISWICSTRQYNCKITVNKRYSQPRPCVLETSFLTFQTIVDRVRTVSHVLNPAHVHFNRWATEPLESVTTPGWWADIEVPNNPVDMTLKNYQPVIIPSVPFIR